jgi:hypothetical protein
VNIFAKKCACGVYYWSKYETCVGCWNANTLNQSLAKTTGLESTQAKTKTCTCGKQYSIGDNTCVDCSLKKILNFPQVNTQPKLKKCGCGNYYSNNRNMCKTCYDDLQSNDPMQVETTPKPEPEQKCQTIVITPPTPISNAQVPQRKSLPNLPRPKPAKKSVSFMICQVDYKLTKICGCGIYFDNHGYKSECDNCRQRSQINNNPATCIGILFHMNNKAQLIKS